MGYSQPWAGLIVMKQRILSVASVKTTVYVESLELQSEISSKCSFCSWWCKEKL